MKTRLIAAVAILTLGSSLAVAGPGGKHEGKRGHRGGEFGAKMAEKLNLTEAQKAQIAEIRKSTYEQNKAFFDTARQTREELRAAREANDTARAEALKGTLESQRTQMKQIRDSEKQRILSILTPEQRTQLEQFKAERGGRHEKRRNNG